MTRWSWVIDQTRCIGCHACTTACKSENDVAVGVFRTWVKNVDVGVFPEVRRHFAVLRCNHCEDAPCVEICPVTAMYQRTDGLVDFDESLCIGCKACMQACPYDAIYMDPDSNTAAKCNFCSHRVDEGLLPACVVVCPVEALVFGDMDDPASRVSRELKAKKVTVRRPEQHTRPKAFYIGAHEATLDPLAAVHEEMYMWSDNPRASRAAAGTPHDARRTMPPRVSYDVPRQRTWDWKVSSYIWTKSIAAGAAIIPAVMALTGTPISTDRLLGRIAPLIAMAALVVTGILLVADLKRPERFWTILWRPQWRSWLARGAVVITAYGALLAAWGWAARSGWERVVPWLSTPVIVLAFFTAVYTAFLFAQCEGRDLWQSRLLKYHLLVHAPVAGLLTLIAAAPLVTPPEGVGVMTWQPYLVTWSAFASAGLVLGFLLALADAFMKHDTANAAAAAHALARGKQSRLFWTSLVLGALVPAALFAVAPVAAWPIAAGLGLLGLWLYGHALILAGQGPPIS